MNVFCLDRDPMKAAHMMCDKHVVKMIVETCQILSAVLDNNYTTKEDIKPSVQLGTAGYPPAHVKHPSTMWAMEAKGNYKWLVKHLRGLCIEYSRRYNKTHSMEGQLMIFEGQLPQLSFAKERKTEFVQAITDKRWHRKDPVEAYRVYYNMEKFTFAKWKLGNVPDWYTGAPQYIVELEKKYAALINEDLRPRKRTKLRV